MITIKYVKRGNAVFISHIDTLRNMVRVFRRAGVSVEFSQGFNPHMLLFFSPPLAIGVSSEAEYVSVDCKGVSAEKMLEAYNKASSNDFLGIAAYETAKSPNLAGKIVAASYLLPCKNLDGARAAVDAVIKAEEYKLSFLQKGETIQKEVRNQIFEIETYDRGIAVTIATGNVNLRADRLSEQFNKDFDTQISVIDTVKLCQYVSGEGGFVEVDKLLASEAVR